MTGTLIGVLLLEGLSAVGGPVVEALDTRLSSAAAPVYEVGLSREARVERLPRCEAACLGLLAEYDDPVDQGRIYAFVARVFAQTGQLDPAKTIEYAALAMKYPMDPTEQAPLYVYWGDAIQVAHGGVRGADLADVRRQAVVPYLAGLKLTLRFDLPEEKPKIPRAEMQDSIVALRRGEEEPNRGAVDAAVAAQRRAVFQRHMIDQRDALRGSIAYMYSRLPLANDELRELALKTLQDESAVDRLMAIVAERIRLRPDAFGGHVALELPKDIDAPSASQLVRDRPGEADTTPGNGARPGADETPAADRSGRSDAGYRVAIATCGGILVAVLAARLVWRAWLARPKAGG